MKVSYNWIREIAPELGPWDPEVADRMATLGFPVEEVRELAAGLGDLVVGHVLAVEPHPNADRLRVCTVDGGSGEVRVVCGAPNVESGGWYPFAPVGAALPGGQKIGRAKLRGETSEGMLCSERELGLGPGKDGLMVLPGPLSPGQPLVEAIRLDDVRLDVEVTSNRPDLLSHVGVARELAGNDGLRLPDIPEEDGVLAEAIERLDRVTNPKEASSDDITVRIEDPDLCSRYLGLAIRGVRVGPSPAWLQDRLRAIGARPINNVVDATNYVLMELGQPLHAFDLARVSGRTIVVRRARPNEPLRTLDDVERRLTTDMLAICDAERPVAVAGVMGGADSEVTDGTTDLLLECALFQPASVRSTRKGLGLSTDASYRFERGVDPEGMMRALLRTARLILATAGGSVDGPIVDCAPDVFERRTVRIRPARASHLLGVPITGEEIGGLLEPLGFESGKGQPTAPEGGGSSDADQELVFLVPGYRSYDVTREVDLIEEVARVRGYDGFSDELRPFRPSSVPDHPLFAQERRARWELSAWGFLETQTPAFAPEGEGEVEILNPVSAEERFLRNRLLPGLLRRLEHNAARGNRDVRLFEIGTGFALGPTGGTTVGGGGDTDPGANGGLPRESTRLALVMHGDRHPAHWSGDPEASDVWDLKAVLERIAGLFAGDGWTVRAEESEIVVLNGEGESVGWGGRAREGSVDLPPWAGDVWVAEVTLPADPAPAPAPVYERVPGHPGVERDLALLLPAGIRVDGVLALVRRHGGAHLAEAGVFDVYRDAEMAEGHRSVAIRLHFRAPERTLKDEEVDEAIGKVVRALEEEMSVGIRGQSD